MIAWQYGERICERQWRKLCDIVVSLLPIILIELICIITKEEHRIAANRSDICLQIIDLILTSRRQVLITKEHNLRIALSCGGRRGYRHDEVIGEQRNGRRIRRISLKANRVSCSDDCLYRENNRIFSVGDKLGVLAVVA